MSPHGLTHEADGSGEPWTTLWTPEALRYGGSGWWFDRVLPHAPRRFLLATVALTLAQFALGLALAADRGAYLRAQDVLAHTWFLPLHLVCVRALGRLWAGGLDPSLRGLGFDDAAAARVRRGAFGTVASVGALALALGFLVRDAWYGLAPDAVTGLVPFDDPDRWDLAALGRPVHVLLLAVWTVEWLLYGLILWLQVWVLAGWVRRLLGMNFRPHLDAILARDGYRHAFTLLGRTATISLVFALGNLLHIHLTGDLFPRDRVEVSGVVQFLQEMADLLSTTLLFVLVLLAAVVFVVALRFKLTRAVNDEFARAGAVTLQDLASDVTGDDGVEALRRRANAQSGLLRAIVFQREVDVIGRRVLRLTTLKAAAPLITAIVRISSLV
jgi:hypothetical protein